MNEIVTSKRSQQIIEKAKVCYSLGLIRESHMEGIIERAQTDPEYTAILDLPMDWDIEAEQNAQRRARAKGWLHRWFG